MRGADEPEQHEELLEALRPEEAPQRLDEGAGTVRIEEDDGARGPDLRAERREEIRPIGQRRRTTVVRPKLAAKRLGLLYLD